MMGDHAEARRLAMLYLEQVERERIETAEREASRGLAVDDRERALLLAFREGAILIVRALDDYLGLKRTMPSKREREK